MSISNAESSDLEELVRSSPTVVVARHRGDMAQDIPIENDSSFPPLKTLLRQFDRVEVLRDESGSVPPRFTVGNPNLGTRMRIQPLGKGHRLGRSRVPRLEPASRARFRRGEGW